MHFHTYQSLVAGILVGSIAPALALPATSPNPGALAKCNNPGESYDNPLDIFIDCGGMETFYDADCYAVLCMGADRVLQRDNSNEGQKRTRSAIPPPSSTQPTNHPPPPHQAQAQNPSRPATRSCKKRGVTRISSSFTSPEEYPYASTAQGGTGALLAGVPQPEQGQQGRNLNSAYATGNVAMDQWFRNNWVFL